MRTGVLKTHQVTPGKAVGTKGTFPLCEPSFKMPFHSDSEIIKDLIKLSE